mgnify:CR=1 FL=1
MKLNFSCGIAIIEMIIDISFDLIGNMRRDGVFTLFGSIFRAKLECGRVKCSDGIIDLGFVHLHLEAEVFSREFEDIIPITDGLLPRDLRLFLLLHPINLL